MKRKLILSFALVFCLLMANIGSSNGVSAAKKRTLTDFHMHLQTQKLADKIKEAVKDDSLFIKPLTEENADTVIAQMDKAGIDKAFCLSCAYIWGMPGFITDTENEYEYVKEENNFTAAQAAKYPSRLTPFFSINPLKDYAIQEIDRCHDVLKMPCLKLHFANSNVDLKNSDHLQKVNNVLAHAEAKGIPVIIHFMNYEEAKDGKFGTQDAQIFIDKILAKHPNLRVCIAHMGGSGGYNDLVGDIFDTFVKAYDTNKKLNKKNLYFDISSLILTEPLDDYMGVTTDEQVKRISGQLKAWGLDQILWGSDYYAAYPDVYLKLTMSKLKLSDKDIQRILYKEPGDFLLKCKK